MLLRNRYLVLQTLGSGGFATTYAIWDLQTQTERVLKVLTETAPKAIELFEQEAQVLARLSHPGIPQVEADSYFQIASSQRWLPCLVMEKINGQTLHDVLEQHPQGCPPKWIVDWLTQAIEILQLLHQQHIIHRDLKPSNLMLRHGSGQLVLIDFGGVKQLRTIASASSTRLFSPGYSPPEQAAGASVNQTADFFALGRTLIHLLTGQSPTAIEDPRTGELNWQQYAQVSPRLANLLEEMVQPDPRRRPPSADVIRSRLVPIIQSYSTRTTAVPLRRPRGPRLRSGLSLWSSLLWLLRSLFWTLRAVLATSWAVLLSVTGAIAGAAIGYGLAFETQWGTDLTVWLSQQLSQLWPQLNIAIGTDALIFALAGWGTAWGLTAAGGLGQRQRLWSIAVPLLSGVSGSAAYLLGWVGLQVVQSEGAAGLTLFAAVAPALLVMGLRMTSHRVTRALVTIVGTAPCIAVLAFDSVLTHSLGQLLASGTADQWSLWACLLFFGLLAGLLAACLSVSHYLLIPLLDWLHRGSRQRSPSAPRYASVKSGR